jgi:hypothetical protein
MRKFPIITPSVSKLNRPYSTYTSTFRPLIRLVSLAVLLVSSIAALPIPAYADSCLRAVNADGCAYGLPADQYNVLLGVMQANPAPAVTPLEPDKANIIKYSDTASKTPHIASSFTGVLVGGLPLPMGWILRTIRPLPLPGGLADAATPVVRRYQRVFIYASLKVDGLTWYLIGPGQWVVKTVVAKLVPATRPEGVGGRWFAVDTQQQTLSAYEGDQLVFATLISSGKGKRITRSGLFPIYQRSVTDNMSGGMGSPDAYAIYDVPWVQYFNSGMALHGAPWHDNFGYPMSHGCVNMSMTDARWAYEYAESAPTAPVLVWRSG